MVTSKGNMEAEGLCFSVAEMVVFSLSEVCVTPPTLSMFVQTLATLTSGLVDVNALSVIAVHVSPSRMRNPLKGLVELVMVKVVAVLIGKVVALPGTRVTPPRETEKPPCARGPVTTVLVVK